MGDILELVKSRRNVTLFLPKFVSWENISRVLDAGRHAPSCGNIQNWKFIVILKPEMKQELAAASYDQFEIAAAFALIVVCAEPEKAERYYGERGQTYSIQNCAAAVQNMLLEAHSLGLATRWVGTFDLGRVKELLAIPEDAEPQAIVALGYAKDIPPKPPKYPLETLVYFGAWRAKIADPAKYLNDLATIMARKAGSVAEAVSKSRDYVADKIKSVGSKKE